LQRPGAALHTGAASIEAEAQSAARGLAPALMVPSKGVGAYRNVALEPLVCLEHWWRVVFRGVIS